MRYLGALIAAVIVGALAGGAMYGLERAGIYLIVLFPLVAGVLVGAAVGAFDRQRRATGLPIIALIGGLVALGVYWGTSYYFFMEDSVVAILERAPRFSREDAQQLIEQDFQSEYGATGVQGYFAFIAAGGLTISDVGDDEGTTLQGNIAYAFWIFEAVLLLGAAVVVCVQRGNRNKPAPAGGGGTGGSLADLQQNANRPDSTTDRRA